MASTTHLHFLSQIGSQKPESIRNRSTKCPFCDRASLTDILAEDGPIVLLKNKYPVLEDTTMTVLIETDDCDAELSVYPKDHLYRVIRFGVEHWLRMEQSGEYASVIFYKNHGPHSGGTIHHPHMQIIGLKKIDYRQTIEPHHFRGHLIAEQPGVLFNISTEPRVGFTEFNVLVDSLAHLDQAADYIQIAAHFSLHHFHKNCSSYNLFFYRFGDLDDPKLAIKIVPRFVTSPLYIGFSIPQVTDRVEFFAKQIRELYFDKEKDNIAQ